MTRKVLLILLLSVVLNATAQLTRYQANFSLSAMNFADTIAIEWSGDQVYVPVDIGGRNYRFLLDTGAGQSVVFRGSPLASGSPCGNIIAHDATGRSDTVPVVVLPPLHLGAVTISGCRATVQQRAAGGSAIEGILGFDLVNGGLAMKIDVPARQLILTDRAKLFNDEPGVWMKYWLNYHVPYIDISPFSGHKERVLFDTGSRQFFAMNKANFDHSTQRRTRADCFVEGRSYGSHAMGHLGVEPAGEVAFLQLDALTVGSYVFSQVHSITTQGGSHLGAMLLRYGAVAFVPARRSMLFQPSIAQQPCVVDNRQVEISFIEENGKPAVGLVWEQGIPYRQGFRQGDIIEQIDGRNVNGFAQFRSWAFQRGREYIFTVRDAQGHRRQVRWVRLP